MTSPDAAAEPQISSAGAPSPAGTVPDAPAPADPEAAPGASTSSGPQADVSARAAAGEPVLPEQSREDTDAAWGEYRERDDDRLYRDRPPHWADY